jgi:arylsulfatase A-like enzyme
MSRFVPLSDRYIPLLLVLACVFASLGSSDAAQPNLLVILADDMGYGDLRCMGSQLLSTPNLDALAQSGVLCTQAYVASAVCSPSRAGLITGRDPRRFGYEGNLNQSAANYATRPDLLGLPPGEHTLGDHLRAAGYATALIGKWHLGVGDGFHPSQRGFDYFCGMLVGSHSYFPKPNSNKLERNGEPLREFSSPYLTDFFTDEALRWLAAQTSSPDRKPWFLFMSYNAPHGPLQATDEDLERFAQIADSKRRTYAAMMFALDRGVGRIRGRLEESGELDNTLICFFSDNGGATGNASWNGPLSGCKGCLREGGVRVPMIWSWPDRLPGDRVDTAVVSSLDLLPTFLAAADAKPLPLADPSPHQDKKNRQKAIAKYGAYDGINLLPQLSGKASAARRTLYWRLQGQTAVLDGPDKLITLAHRPPQLFRPARDVAEATNRFDSDRTRTDELYRMLGQWESMLTTAPLWDSSPYWISQSADHYDTWGVRSEPK